MARARASATRCFCPPERFPADPGQIRDVHLLHPVRDALGNDRARDVPGAKAECDIVAHGHVGKYG